MNTFADRCKRRWKRHRRAAVVLGVWAAVAASLWGGMQVRSLTLGELWLSGVAWASSNPVAPLLYILAYAVRPLLLLSSILLTVSGGFLFGAGWGAFYTVIGANLSATVAFWVGRSFGQAILSEKGASGLIQEYAQRMRQESFETVLVMRFLFLPYDLVNYLAGLLRIRYAPFLWATLLGSLPGTVAFVLVGAALDPDQLSALLLTGQPPQLDWRLLVGSLAMLAVSFGLSRFLKSRKRAA
ncbi:MAG: VTT domain-containing protein [Caldilinea sp.]|jgi:uncharacterized membrane protein YdjX (TVP38/TMEM64 family)|nr:VTT domain-containing protein [Caldilinea sp.]